MKAVLSHAAIVYIFLLLLISNTYARPLLSNQDAGTKPNEVTATLQGDDFSNLLGLEVCVEDEGCEKRRIVAEAHLDYIYTQHQRP